MKSIIFWDMTPLSCIRRFGGTYRLHLQGRRIRSARNQQASRWLACWFLPELILTPWKWRRCVPPKRRLTLNGLRGIISQKIILYKTTASYSRSPGLKYWYGPPPEFSLVLSQFLQANIEIIPQIRRRLNPSTWIPIHYSVIMLSFNTTRSQLLKGPFNK
jgi:hypothetical protein